jgi:hypothetical protein
MSANGKAAVQKLSVNGWSVPTADALTIYVFSLYTDIKNSGGSKPFLDK